VSLRELTYAFTDESEMRHSRMGLRTGFDELDALISGLQTPDLIVVAGRPSAGKTTLALNIASYVGTQCGRGVGIFCLQMSKEQVLRRLLATEARVDPYRLGLGLLRQPELDACKRASEHLMACQILIHDRPFITARDICDRCRRLPVHQRFRSGGCRRSSFNAERRHFSE